MVEQKADQLTSRVAAAANNRSLHHRWNTSSLDGVMLRNCMSHEASRA
jgi:hypothetical protein